MVDRAVIVEKNPEVIVGNPMIKIKRTYGPKLGSKGMVYWAVTFIAGGIILGMAFKNALDTGFYSMYIFEMFLGYGILYMHFNWESFLRKRSCIKCQRRIERDWECGLRVGETDICVDCVTLARVV